MTATPVSLTDDLTETPVSVEVPAGWVRVWKGPALPGDRYVHALRLADGVVEWLEVTFARLFGDGKVVYSHNPYADSGTYTCLIRQKTAPGDIGVPCLACRVRPPLPESRYCTACLPETI